MQDAPIGPLLSTRDSDTLPSLGDPGKHPQPTSKGAVHMDESRLRHNLHVHSHFSDGLYSVEQIIVSAADQGLSVIGISDHFHSRKLRPGTPSVAPGGVADYAAAVREAANLFDGLIRVVVGIEVNSAAGDTAMTTLDWSAGPLDTLDYVLFEAVGERSEEGLDLDELVEIRAQIGVPVGLAHTDLAGSLSSHGTQSLLGALAEHEIFVELCPTDRHAHWLPRELFADAGLTGTACGGAPDGLMPVWYYRAASEVYGRLREHGVLVSVGTDMHDDLRTLGRIDDAVCFIQEFDLTGQLLIDHI
jgi:PHP domain-containing protein